MQHTRKGFTIIELLVAMTLFAVVIAVAVGGFIQALRTQRQLAAFTAANTNVSLVIEQIAREVRVGTSFTVRPDSIDPRGDTLTFTNSRGEAVEYRLDTERRTITRSVNGGTEQPLITESLNVKALAFNLAYEETVPTDDYPTRVTITITISPEEYGISTSEVHIQTTVSARSLAS